MHTDMQQMNWRSTHPSWVSDSIVYQIFPDRFRSSELLKARQNLHLQQWGTDPSRQGFQGGDLFGIIESLDYLQEMGINCLYLNPIFCSAANHRYHTYDYYKVDPLLGGEEAFDSLVTSLHDRGMRLVLDGVFNHCGRGFWPFHNLLENGDTSPYKDWFHVYKWPLKPYSRTGKNCGYKCWWNNPALPVFNHDHIPVRKYLISVAEYWVRKGIDGWRLDVPDEVPHQFWKEFNQVVKSINPEVWIVGEIWGDARLWLKDGDFDGVMNYRLGWSSLSWCAEKKINTSYKNPAYPISRIDGNTFVQILKTTFDWYTPETNRCQLNLLDSHDVPRSINTLKGDYDALKLALTILFLQVGAPCIYYGTEIGLSGGIEPSCREAFVWDKKKWLIDLRPFLQSLVSLRKEIFEFIFQGFDWIADEEDGLIATSSIVDKNSNESSRGILVILNRSRSNYMKIEDSVDKLVWKLGLYDQGTRRLGPQSVVILRKKFHCD